MKIQLILIMSFLIFQGIFGEVIDIAHPKNYVKIYELDKYGERRVLYAEKKGDSLLEIDINSKIEIEFDREFIQKGGFDYKIDVEGMAKSGGKSRKIEIPGYSVIGETKMSSEKSFYNFSKIVNTLNASHLDITYDIALIMKDNSNVSKLTVLEKDQIFKFLLSKKVLIVKSLSDISNYDKKVLDIIVKKLYDETKNYEDIKEIADNIIVDLDNLSEENLSSILEKLGIMARYGNALIENGKPSKKYKEIEESLQGTIKDTEIMVSETGINTDGILIIKIKNQDRDFELKFIVKSFGLNTSLNDSYFFIKREKENGYNPIPGITLSKLYTPRKDKKIFRVLYPGFGINVSFPQQDNNTDVTAGITMSLFKNSVFFTLGKELSNENGKIYYGIGFSFAKFAGKIY